MMNRTGLIISGNKREYLVTLDDGTKVFVTVRKNLIYAKGPLFVGDKVIVDCDNTVIDFLPRINRLIRPKMANVSFGAVVTSTFEPSFSSFLLEKYLSYLLFSHVTPLIFFTKIDRLSEKEYLEIENYKNYYEKFGIKSYLLSTLDPSTFLPVREELRGKTVIFLGQTGAGKSSAVNALDPKLNRSIGEYSVALGRGKHETKEIVLFPFLDGFIGDTPGFSSLELPMTEEELSSNFPGFTQSSHRCYFSDCLHLEEKGCTIKERMTGGEIRQESYENYKKLLQEIKEKRR